jgi:Ser-tRNA(Ala) deacylase AlaX
VPTDKPTRVVTIDGFSQPCGGTHVPSLAALKGMKIEKIRSKKGNTKISYSLPQM